MRAILTTLIVLTISTAAYGQETREAIVTLPEAVIPRVIELCVGIRDSLPTPPATFTLDDCMTKFVHRKLKAHNRRITQNEERQAAESNVDTRVGDFDNAMPD